jgi:cob(I)alamin adenosyltransferase
MTTAALYHLIRIVAALRRLWRRAPVLSREQKLMETHIEYYWRLSDREEWKRDRD